MKASEIDKYLLTVPYMPAPHRCNPSDRVLWFETWLFKAFVTDLHFSVPGMVIRREQTYESL